jgi:erythromycin esterase-like protein
MSVEGYARAALLVPESCEDEVISMLIELRNKASQYQADGIEKIGLVTKNTKKENSKTRTRTEKGPGQRAIGVVYNPEYERYGNYVPSVINKRYDMYLHIDKTHALSPLHMPEVKDKEIPENFSYWIII